MLNKITAENQISPLLRLNIGSGIWVLLSKIPNIEVKILHLKSDIEIETQGLLTSVETFLIAAIKTRQQVYEHDFISRASED